MMSYVSYLSNRVLYLKLHLQLSDITNMKIIPVSMRGDKVPESVNATIKNTEKSIRGTTQKSAKTNCLGEKKLAKKSNFIDFMEVKNRRTLMNSC